MAPVTAIVLAALAFNRLYVADADATAFLRSNWNKFEENYHPNYAFDDDPTTAWVAAKTGETLTWAVSPLKTADSVLLKIRNGYQKSKALYAANARPHKVEIHVRGPGNKTVESRTFDLEDKEGWQEVKIELGAKASLAGMSLTVITAYPGTKYTDVCISDIQTFVASTVHYDAAAEGAKQARLKAWTKERLDRATYFAKLPAPYPLADTHLAEVKPETRTQAFHAPKYDLQSTKELAAFFGAAKAQRLADLASELKAVQAGTGWFSAAKKEHFKAPDVEGTRFTDDFLGPVLDYARLENVAFFGTTKAVASETHDDQSGLKADVISNVKLKKAGADIVAATFTRSRTFVERGIYTLKQDYLLVFDGGRLREVYRHSPADPEEFESSERFDLMTLSEDPKGKINRIAIDGGDLFAEVSDDEQQVPSATLTFNHVTAATP